MTFHKIKIINLEILLNNLIDLKIVMNLYIINIDKIKYLKYKLIKSQNKRFKYRFKN